VIQRGRYLLAFAVLATVVVVAALSPVSPRAALAALTARPIKEGRSGPAPHRAAKAMKLVRADVRKLAGNYEHKRYRAVCSDLTARERRQLGGTTKCMLKVTLLNSLAPIKRFTIVKAKLDRRHRQATVVLIVNGNGKRTLRAVFRWEAGLYRLDHQIGSLPSL
jgi:hypothetical protein